MVFLCPVWREIQVTVECAGLEDQAWRLPVADGVELCIGTAGQNSPFLQLHRMPALYSLRGDELGLACRHGC